MTKRQGLFIGSAGITAAIAGVFLLMASPEAPAQTLSVSTQPQPFNVSNFLLVSQQRIDRNVFEYVYRASVTNSSTKEYSGVSGRLTATSRAVVVVDGVLAFGGVAANGQVTSTDTFTIRQDRSIAGSLSLQWTVTATPTQWETYSDADVGLTFRYPTFGRPVATEQTVNADGSRNISIGLFQLTPPASGVQAYKDTFYFEIFQNPSGQSLDQWFTNNVDDIARTLTTAGTFRHETLANGFDALVVSDGPLPDDYGGGPVSSVYVISPLKHTVVAISQTHENELAILVPGLGDAEYLELLKSILGSLNISE